MILPNVMSVNNNILTDFKIATPGSKLNISRIKDSIVTNLTALYSSIIVVDLLKILLSCEKFNVLKMSSIEYRGHSFNETIGFSHNFCCFHPIEIEKKNDCL